MENSKKKIEEAGGRASVVTADVRDVAQLRGLIDAAVAATGRLDIMVNNAGLSGVQGGIADIPAAGYDATMAVLLRGVYLGIKHAARAMTPQRRGAIVSNASIAGLSTAISAPHIYKVAKAGVIHLTGSVAVELGPSGIRVNSVCPGFIPTPIFAHDVGMAGAAATRTAERIAPLFDDLQPIRRAGRAGDIAAAILWLASDKASFVTGHALVVDGGVTAGAEWAPDPTLAAALKAALDDPG